ncbi:MAG: YkgJ family cysteine cluster protein [Desulfurococcaceae archaeon]
MLQRHVLVKVGEKTRFICIRCGRCCSSGPNVSLTAHDICRMSKYLGVNWRELRGRYVLAVVSDAYATPVLRGVGEGVCAFLKYDGGKPQCLIYEARPLRCFLYPFIPTSPGKLSEMYVDTYCQGVGLGGEIEPEWSILRQYSEELKYMYERMHSLVFHNGLEPLEALERVIDEVCSQGGR